MTTLASENEWFKHWFGEEYLRLYAHRSNEEARSQVDFILSQLTLPDTSRILDLACGAGRHLAAFRHRGFQAFGCDLSASLLSHANRSIENLPLVRCDIRQLPFRIQTFDLLTNFFTSFGYLASDDEHIALLSEWKRVCKANGKLLIDYLNRDEVITHLVSEDKKTVGEQHVIQHRRLSDDGKRIEKRITIKTENQKGEKTFVESVRMYSQEELKELLAGAGWSIQQSWGDFRGNRFTSSSPRLVVLATPS